MLAFQAKAADADDLAPSGRKAVVGGRLGGGAKLGNRRPQMTDIRDGVRDLYVEAGQDVRAGLDHNRVGLADISDEQTGGRV